MELTKKKEKKKKKLPFHLSLSSLAWSAAATRWPWRVSKEAHSGKTLEQNRTTTLCGWGYSVESGNITVSGEWGVARPCPWSQPMEMLKLPKPSSWGCARVANALHGDGTTGGFVAVIQSASSSSRARDITHPLLHPQRKGGEERKKTNWEWTWTFVHRQ